MVTQRKFRIGIVVVGVLLLGASLVMWQVNEQTRADRVFDRMLRNALTTSSVVKSSDITSETQDVHQMTHLQTSPDARVHALVEINQKGDGGSYVKRESLVTQTNNFVRLVNVRTSQVGPNGKPYDFSSILGIWAQSPADASNNSLTQLYGQNVAVPYAHLSTANRQAVLDQIYRDQVYKIDYSKVKEARFNGRKAYVYEVGVKPVAFINMMKTVGQLEGVRDYADVDANSYKNLPDVTFRIVVDALSADLVQVDYGNDQIENYSGVGLRHIESDPKNAVSTVELQQRLQKLQQ